MFVIYDFLKQAQLSNKNINTSRPQILTTFTLLNNVERKGMSMCVK